MQQRLLGGYHVAYNPTATAMFYVEVRVTYRVTEEVCLRSGEG